MIPVTTMRYLKMTLRFGGFLLAGGAITALTFLAHAIGIPLRHQVCNVAIGLPFAFMSSANCDSVNLFAYCPPCPYSFDLGALVLDILFWGFVSHMLTLFIRRCIREAKESLENN